MNDEKLSSFAVQKINTGKPEKPYLMRIYKKCPHLFWFCSLPIFQIWSFWKQMQQKTQKLLFRATKSACKGRKRTGTDTNSVFISIRAEKHRLQKEVTWAKKVEYGISSYQIFKFWQKPGIRANPVFGPK